MTDSDRVALLIRCLRLEDALWQARAAHAAECAIFKRRVHIYQQRYYQQRYYNNKRDKRSTRKRDDD